jgi:Kef-type K+ transport system membrane component KefB
MESQGMLLLFDLGIIILTATVFAFIAKILKQPLVLAYVLTGILIGPFGFRLVTSEDIIRIFAEIGIALLLFIVGLELDIKRLKDVGKVSVGCGLGQIFATFIFGFALSRVLGFSQLESFYIGFGLTISSTMVVIKLLSDKKELDTLHGKIILGTLLVQDMVTIMVLAALPTLSELSTSIVTIAFLKGFGLISIAIVSSKYLFAPFIRYAAKSVELLFLFALSWCFLFSSFSYLLDFSIAVGAFLAGVSLASFPYNLEIVGRIRSLRDFFVTIFFVSLGMQVPIEIAFLVEVFILAVFVLVGSPIITFFITNMFGYERRTAFLTAISLAQISEFSLILATQGLFLGHISSEIFSLIAWVALVTITISSYFIIHSSRLYKLFLPLIDMFSSASSRQNFEHIPEPPREHVVVFGYHRTGYDIVKTLRKLKKNFLVVDYNPEIIKKLKTQGISCIYGDVEDLEILERVDLQHAHLVISTIPEIEDNLLIIKQTRERNPKAIIIMRAESIDHVLELYKKGADYVIFPEMLGGEKASEILERWYYTKQRKEGERKEEERYKLQEDEEKVRSIIEKTKQRHMEKLERIQEEDLLIKYEPSLLDHWRKKGFQL